MKHVSRMFSTSESNRVTLFSVHGCDGLCQSKALWWDEGWNSRLRGSCLHCHFTWELLLLLLLSGLWNISISQRDLGCYGTFQSSDNGHSKKHTERKDDCMSRQGLGSELKPLHVCILMRGRRWTLANGSTEGGWWDGLGVVQTQMICC